jgi:regulator of nonsense transcripts 1
VQYRFPRELADFPSREFYEGGLQTGIQDSAQVLTPLCHSSFPWPRRNDRIFPVVFVQCSSEEDTGRQSKSNTGQAELVKSIASKLHEGENRLKVTILTPYKNQVKALQALQVPVDCFTIDSFQGRESDLVVFSTVRCNTECDIGFLGDERRLNVMWTRAKLALIIVGDRKTLTSKSDLWRRAIMSCMEINL